MNPEHPGPDTAQKEEGYPPAHSSKSSIRISESEGAEGPRGLSTRDLFGLAVVLPAGVSTVYSLQERSVHIYPLRLAH